MKGIDRIITRRRLQGKVIGYIREREDCPWSCTYSGRYYTLHTADGTCIDKDLNYNKLHNKLYSMAWER